ncbi:MAG: hypothetical protein GYA02_14370 [Clostridiaceae bacterium]|nr:hypothetical protein [Clostridiaceae bacterium]
MMKSKGYPVLSYNAADEVVFLTFYESKNVIEESSIFSDCVINMRMSEWDLHDYSIVIQKPETTKELHRNVYIELFNYLFEKDAEKVIKIFDEYLELGINGGEERMKEYTLNNRRVSFTKFQGNKKFGISIGFQD